MPPNLQSVTLRFARRRAAKVLGGLASRAPQDIGEGVAPEEATSSNDNDNEPPSKKTRLPEPGERVAGILVTHQFQSKLVAPDDLATYTPLRVGKIASKLHVPFGGSVATLTLFLQEMFAGIQTTTTPNEDGTGDLTTFSLQDKVSITVGKTPGVATVVWQAHPENDVLADAVVALISQAQCSPAAIRLTSQPCRHRGSNAAEQQFPAEPAVLTESRIQIMRDTLRRQFENVEVVTEGNRATFEIRREDTTDVTCTLYVNFPDGQGQSATVHAESTDGALAQNVQDCIQSLVVATYPIPIDED